MRFVLSCTNAGMISNCSSQITFPINVYATLILRMALCCSCKSVLLIREKKLTYIFWFIVFWIYLFFTLEVLDGWVNATCNIVVIFNYPVNHQTVIITYCQTILSRHHQSVKYNLDMMNKTDHNYNLITYQYNADSHINRFNLWKTFYSPAFRKMWKANHWRIFR